MTDGPNDLNSLFAVCYEAGYKAGLEKAGNLCAEISQDWETCVRTNNPDWSAYARGADECTDVIRDLMNGTPLEDDDGLP